MKLPLHLRELNRATDYFNPLRGLDIPRVVRLLEEGERGKYDELQKLNRMAEKRHPTLRALKRRKSAALKKLTWNVKVPDTLPAGVTAAQAEAQRVLLRTRYDAIENLPQAFGFLALAEFRGYSHLEPHYQDNNPSLPIVRLEPVPQWHWLRGHEDFAWRYDASARGNESDSVPIDPADFIIREIDDPLCEIALLCFIRRNFGKKNWTVFQADYAIPAIFAMLGENTPSDKVKEWLALMKEVTNNSRGALPPGSKAEALDVGDRDGAQFDNYIQAEDKDLVLAGTSGQLTMLTADTGLNGGGQGDAHEKTFDDLAQAEAAEISALLQEQFDKRILAVEFPSQPPVAYFELAAQDREDVDALAERTAKFSTAGFEADEKELSEKSGMTLRKKAAPAPSADPLDRGTPRQPVPQEMARDGTGTGTGISDSPLANRAAAVAKGRDVLFRTAVMDQVGAAIRQDIAPIADRLAALVAIEDEATFRSAWSQFEKDLPDLQRQVLTKSPAAAEALAQAIGTALVSGYGEAAQDHGAAQRTTRNPKL